MIAAAVLGEEAPAPKVLTWVYNCQPGGSFGAAFVAGGPEATLWLPGLPAIPLTQLMSGSGARYGDKTYELFIKGREGFLEKSGTRIADNCQAVRPRNLAPVGQGRLTEADAGKAAQLKVGQKVQFSLPVQSGTGYSWLAPPKSPLLELEYGTELFVPRPGAPAVELITATAKRAAFLVLEFQYARPWEKGTAPAKTLRFPMLITD